VGLGLRGDTVHCVVSDDGGAQAATRSPGSGLKLIAALAQELRGTVHQKFDRSGSFSSLVFPEGLACPTSCPQPRH